MKKLLSLLAACSLILCSAGCAKDDPSSGSSDMPESSAVSETSEESSSEESSSEETSSEAETDETSSSGNQDDSFVEPVYYEKPSSSYAPEWEEISDTFEYFVLPWEGVTFQYDGSFTLPEGEFAVVQMIIDDYPVMAFYVSDLNEIYILTNKGDLQHVGMPNVRNSYEKQYFSALDMMIGGNIEWNVNIDYPYQPNADEDPYYPSEYDAFHTAAEFEQHLKDLFTPNGIDHVLQNTDYFDMDGQLYLRGGVRGNAMGYAFHTFGDPIEENGTITFPMYIYSYDLSGENMEATGLIMDEFQSENAKYVLKNVDGRWLVDSFTLPF